MNSGLEATMKKPLSQYQGKVPLRQRSEPWSNAGSLLLQTHQWQYKEYYASFTILK